MASPTDDAIREMLESRASRVHTGSIGLATIVAAAGPRASVRLRGALGLAPRLWLVASTVAAVLVASALIAIPLFNRPTGSSMPSGFADASGATGSPSDVRPSSAPTSSVRLLTPAEVGELARTRSRELSTKMAAVRGRLALDEPGCSTCAGATFVNGDFGIRVRIVGNLRTSWGTSSARTSAWVIRFTPEVENGLPIVEALGELRTGMSGGLTSTVIELLYDEVGAVGSYAAVDGWLVRTPVHPCASFVMPSDAPTDLPSYGCPEDDYLTDAEFQPTQPDGSSSGPGKGILLPVESYAKWAPNPTILEQGVEPRRATFLLQLVHTSACGPTDDCFAGPLIRRWQIAARLDPIPNLEAAPTREPEASSLPVVGDTYPGGIPRSVGGEPVLIGLDSQQRMAGTTDASSFLIGGWFGGGPLMCGGAIGPRDPNPLAYHGCAMYQITGVPGIPYYPPTLVMPPPGSDGPIVLRVHVNDPGAETCWDVAACRARLVIDDVVWLGDASTSAAPIGPTAAITQALRVEFADVRIQPDKSQAYVDEDRFALPIACPAPLPKLTFELRGDPRMALLAVFPDPGARESVQSMVDPSVALGCLPDLINRVGEPRWIGRENVMLLVVADEKTAGDFESDFGPSPGDASKRIALPSATLDRSLETIRDYLAARAAGERDHAIGYRLILPQEDSFDAYAEWQSDTLRRRAADAVDGTITLLSGDATEADVGAEFWGARPDGSRLWLYRVHYLASTDLTLGSETYVVIHDPKSTFADWQLVRIAGAPYPRIAIPPSVSPPPDAKPGMERIPGNNGSGDTPCQPVGQPCG